MIISAESHDSCFFEKKFVWLGITNPTFDNFSKRLKITVKTIATLKN